jgi:cob(II)yrinic acid a,c-diamide reductase
MTAWHESRRAGVLVETVQVCGEEPPLLCVAMKSGHWIEPIIRDSHSFAICILDQADRLTLRKFVGPEGSREPGDPFDCLPCERLVTGSPVIRRAIAAFDCRVTRHLDIDDTHSLYIGTVMASRVYKSQSAPLHLPSAQPDQATPRPIMMG